MGNDKNVDFSAIATKYGVKCADGLTIEQGAFAHQDGQTVPMVYMHNHNDINNVIGHCILHEEPEGVRLYGYLNEDVEAGKNAKKLIQHGDIKAVSIYANQLTKTPSRTIVTHGNIKEVSLVLSGANPGAIIDYVAFQHADGLEDVDETQAFIFNGNNIEKDENKISHSNLEKKGEKNMENSMNLKREDLYYIIHDAVAEAVDQTRPKTIEEIFNTLTDEQKDAVYAIIGMIASNEEEAEDEEAEDEDEEY